MPGHEKILKKVEQDRSKGQLDRALTRLKEAMAQSPREFSLAQEAAGLCFQMGRTLEGAGILRAAMKRCPEQRAFALDLLEREFATAKQLELAEILYDSYLATPDLDRARDVVSGLAEADRTKLLAKLRAKLQSVTEDAPDDASRLVGLLLALALALSAMGRPAEVAAALSRMLDLEAAQNDTVGRLCKQELRHAPDCGEIQLLLARCYANVGKPDLAAEQVSAAGRHPEFRARALELAEKAGEAPALVRAHAELLLQEGRHDEACLLLDGLLSGDGGWEGAVRHTLEGHPDGLAAHVGLRLVLARAMARTGALRPACKALEDARAAGADAAQALAAADELLEHDPRNIDLVLLRARLAATAQHPEAAAEGFRTVLRLDPSRAESLRAEVEAACKATADAGLGRLLVELYVQLELPHEASEALQRLSATRSLPAEVLFELSADIAGQYGLSATLLVVFVESAIDTHHEREARAAVAHYLASPGVRVADFARHLAVLLQQRADLAPRLARAVDGMALPVDLRFMLATAGLEGEAALQALVELGTLVAERPELRETALVAIEAFLARSGDVADALILAAELCDAGGRTLQAAHYLARGVRADPAAADRMWKLGEKVLRRDGSEPEAWREILLALADAKRYRHARELCYLATHSLPPEKQGFVHTVLGEILIESNQVQQAVNALESALGCEDTPLERVVAGLERAVQADGRHGYARYVLAAALLRLGGAPDRALQQLAVAVQHDDLVVDLALDLIGDHTQELGAHAPAQVLEGTLRLRKGERRRGVALLDRALSLQPELAAQLVGRLESEWDRDGGDLEIGLAFAHALRCSGQARRATRLYADLARRFPDGPPRIVVELEALVASEPLGEAHRILWDIQLQRGDRDAALHHLQLALEGPELDDEARRELLETALGQVPDADWVVRRLAEVESRAGNLGRVEELLRGLLQRDPNSWQSVLDSLRAVAPSIDAENLQLFEIDCLLAGRRGPEVLEALRGFRIAWPAQREAALARYRQLVEQRSAGSQADLELGLLLKEYGQVDAAVTVFETTVARLDQETHPADETASPHERELRLALASLYVELGREREGRDLLSSVLDRPGDHQEAYGFLERLARHGLLSKLKNVRETIASSPTNLRARLELARLSLVSLDFEGAREALHFNADSPAVEAARRFLLARSYAEQDQPQVAVSVLRSLELDDVADPELRRNVTYLRAVCHERLSEYGEAHALFLQLLSEFPYFKDTRERARVTYQKHLETALESRAEVLEKRTQLDVT